MNDSERTVCRFLESLRLGPVEHEPGGKNPPDFLVAGRIAVEARRLNENEEVNGGHRGLEVTAKPLHRAVVKALAQSGPPPGAYSWFVHYIVQRPLPAWKETERLLSDGVRQFRARLDDPPSELRLGRALRLSFHRANRRHDTLLLLGGGRLTMMPVGFWSPNCAATYASASTRKFAKSTGFAKNTRNGGWPSRTELATGPGQGRRC